MGQSNGNSFCKLYFKVRMTETKFKKENSIIIKVPKM